MPHIARRLILGAIATLVLATTLPRAHAQAAPTVSRGAQLSLFAGGTLVETGLNSGKNASITAGVDYGFFRLWRIDPAVELRGTFPFDKGHVDSQENGLIGLRVASPFGRYRPYVNLLYGRGEITYATPLPSPHANVFYTDNSTNVVSPGGGVDIRLGPGFSGKLDVQYERLSTPVTPTPHIYATAANIGLVYNLEFHQRHGL